MSIELLELVSVEPELVSLESEPLEPESVEPASVELVSDESEPVEPESVEPKPKFDSLEPDCDDVLELSVPPF